MSNTWWVMEVCPIWIDQKGKEHLKMASVLAISSLQSPLSSPVNGRLNENACMPVCYICPLMTTFFWYLGLPEFQVFCFWVSTINNNFFWQKGSWQKCNWGSHILNLLMSAIDKVFRKKGLFCLLPPFPAQKKREVIQHWPYKKLSEHPFPQILSLSPNIISHLYKSYLHQWFKFKAKMRRWMKGMGSFDGTGAFAFAPQSHFD